MSGSSILASPDFVRRVIHSTRQEFNAVSFEFLNGYTIPVSHLSAMDKDARFFTENMSHSIQGLFLMASKNLEILDRLCALYDLKKI